MVPQDAGHVFDSQCLNAAFRGDFNHLPCVAQTYLAFACISVLDILLQI